VLIVEPEISNFFTVVSTRPDFPDIVFDTPGNPENPGKCPDSPAYEEESNSTEFKLAQI
jgi:hypothetical protein